jgi:hypothetical protein
MLACWLCVCMECNFVFRYVPDYALKDSNNAVSVTVFLVYAR